jgi:hypothetical protein
MCDGEVECPPSYRALTLQRLIVTEVVPKPSDTAGSSKPLAPQRR